MTALAAILLGGPLYLILRRLHRWWKPLGEPGTPSKRERWNQFSDAKRQTLIARYDRRSLS